MKKNIVYITILIFLLSFSESYCNEITYAELTQDEEYNYSIEIIDEIHYYKLIEECDNRKNLYHELANFVREKDPLNEKIISYLSSKWYEYDNLKKHFDNKFIEYKNEEKLKNQYKIYPIATKVVYKLKENGYNKYVISGIVSNMMSESGGNTLNLKEDAWNKSGYYGVCQWSTKYNPSIYGKNIDYQIDYLCSSIEVNLNTYGYKYEDGFTYKDFVEMQDEKAASEAFLKCYERGSLKTLSKRKDNATIVLEYYFNE